MNDLDVMLQLLLSREKRFAIRELAPELKLLLMELSFMPFELLICCEVSFALLAIHFGVKMASGPKMARDVAAVLVPSFRAPLKWAEDFTVKLFLSFCHQRYLRLLLSAQHSAQRALFLA